MVWTPSCGIRSAQRADPTSLAFRELESFPRAGLPGFFSLLHSRIPTQQALGFEWSAQICVHLEKSACNCQLCSPGLSHSAASTGVNKQIVSIHRLGGLKRLQYDVLQRHSREIIFEAAAVDVDFAAAGHHANACDRRFAAACSDELLSLWHRNDLGFLNFDSLGLLRSVRMRIAAIDL
jgi:hypothetical protein